MGRGLRISPFHRLFFKLTISLGLILALLAAFLVALPIRGQHQRAIRSMVETAEWVARAVEWGARDTMHQDQRAELQAMINSITLSEQVNLIRIFNKKGRIMFSSAEEEVGRTVDMKAQICAGCHFQEDPTETRPLLRNHWVLAPHGQDPDRALDLVKPITADPSCSASSCHVHSPERTVLGLAEVRLSLAAVDREHREATRSLLLLAALIFGAAWIILPLFIYFFVNRPLSSLLAGTRRIARGDYDQPLKLKSRDEMGALAEAFEQMRLRVKSNTEDLAESRQLFKTMFEQVPCYISVQDREFRLLAVNDLFKRDFGGKLGDYCYHAYKGRNSVCPNCAVAKTLADGQIHAAEETGVGQDGNPIHFLVLTAPVYDLDGRLTSVMEMSTDVTAIRRLEMQLKQSEEKYHLLFDNDPNPTFLLSNSRLSILDANERALTDLRYSRLDLIGRSFLDLIQPAERDRVEKALWGGEKLVQQVKQVREDGSRLFVDIRASYGQHLSQKAVIVSTADITERLRTEQQLIQASKMATLGEMSAGVAHELNQPLTVIGTGASFVKKRLALDKTVQPDVLAEVVQEMADQVERASKIINHLREFGRKSEVENTLVDLNTPIRGVFSLLGQQLRLRNIRVVMDLDGGLPPIRGDANRLEQVFINFIINSRDAIESARENDQAEGDPSREGLIEIRTAVRRGRIRVTVLDNGCGIKDQDQDRIFEPFFTTKEVGQGTGLGLSISYGIISDYGGTIKVASHPGKGTEITLEFPAATED